MAICLIRWTGSINKIHSCRLKRVIGTRCWLFYIFRGIRRSSQILVISRPRKYRSHLSRLSPFVSCRNSLTYIDANQQIEPSLQGLWLAAQRGHEAVVKLLQLRDSLSALPAFLLNLLPTHHRCCWHVFIYYLDVANRGPLKTGGICLVVSFDESENNLVILSSYMTATTVTYFKESLI